MTLASLQVVKIAKLYEISLNFPHELRATTGFVVNTAASGDKLWWLLKGTAERKES